MQILKYILTTLSLVLLASCSKEPAPEPPPPSRVLLVYIGVDNNLLSYEEEKLQGLRDGWTGQDTDKIIVYIDRPDTGARLVELSSLAPTEAPREIASFGRENSASAETLSRVIRLVSETYPVDSYGLLVFSHASGWLPQGALNKPTRSIIVDGTREMELSDFASAIPDGLFQYIVFETCHMAGIEVAYELRYKAPYILASSAEIVHPGFAPVYASATPQLLAGDLEAFGKAVYNHTLTYTESNLQRSATYSVIRTAALESLATFVRENCDMNLSGEIDVASLQKFDRLTGYSLFFDFEDYHSRLCVDDVRRAELSRLVGQCVVWKASTPGFMTQEAGYNGFMIHKHSGLTTYVPQTRFPKLNEAYSRLEWAKATWHDQNQ